MRIGDVDLYSSGCNAVRDEEGNGGPKGSPECSGALAGVHAGADRVDWREVKWSDDGERRTKQREQGKLRGGGPRATCQDWLGEGGCDGGRSM